MSTRKPLVLVGGVIQELPSGDDIQGGATTAEKAVWNAKTDDSDIQNGSLIYAADAGSTDAYAITLSPVPSSYTDGMVIHFKANTINTGAATLNVNSLGAKAIKKNYNYDLADGDIKAGQRVSVIYDGTNFQMISPIASPLIRKCYRNSNFSTQSTTVVTVTDLTFTVEANKIYHAHFNSEMRISNTAADARLYLRVPTGTKIYGHYIWKSSDSASYSVGVVQNTAGTDSDLLVLTTTISSSGVGLYFEITIEVGSTAGSVSIGLKTSDATYYAYVYSPANFTLIG
jgi:hypothetical protein